jgi:hypothetical protein
VVLNCKEEINYLTCESVKRFQINNKRKRVNSTTAILALIKRGKKGIIKIRKLRNGGNIIRERGELMVKSKVNIVRNLQLRTF